MRRVIMEEPMSRQAIWSGRFAVFGLVVAVLSIILVRTDLLEVEPALLTFGAALVFAAFAMLLAVGAFVVIWRQGIGGFARALGAMFLGILLLAYPGYLVYRASKLPAINDVTTDPVNPPAFGKLASLRPPGTDTYPPRFAPLQEKAFPDIVPLQFDASPQTAYREALSVVEKRKWQVVDEMPPERGRDGYIAAVARTLIMGFRDDVVIRVRAVGDGSRVDVRSASRYGKADFGANARRVTALLGDIDSAVSEAPPEQVKPPPKPKPKARPPRRPHRTKR